MNVSDKAKIKAIRIIVDARARAIELRGEQVDMAAVLAETERFVVEVESVLVAFSELHHEK
jgi:hypothetical protein